jgi:hypothetical protein
VKLNALAANPSVTYESRARRAGAARAQARHYVSHAG